MNTQQHFTNELVAWLENAFPNRGLVAAFDYTASNVGTVTVFEGLDEHAKIRFNFQHGYARLAMEKPFTLSTGWGNGMDKSISQAFDELTLGITQAIVS